MIEKEVRWLGGRICAVLGFLERVLLPGLSRPDAWALAQEAAFEPRLPSAASRCRAPAKRTRGRRTKAGSRSPPPC